MPEYLAPGVFVEETSFRAKSIEGVSTSTTGFAGPARRGPTSGQPTLVTSFADYVRVFGGLEDLSFTDPKTNYLAHSVRAYFNEGGSRLYVARAFSGTPDTATAKATVDGNVSFKARFPGSGGNGKVRIALNTARATVGAMKRAADGTMVVVGQTADTPGRLVSTGQPPFNVPNNASLTLSFNGGANVALSFKGRNAEVFGDDALGASTNIVVANQTLAVKIGGQDQTVTLPLGNLTPAEIVDTINRQIRGGYARLSTSTEEAGDAGTVGRLVLGTDARGSNAAIETTASNTALHVSVKSKHNTADANNTVGDLSAVTLADITTLLTAATNAGEAKVEANKLVFVTKDAGTGKSVAVVGASPDPVLGIAANATGTPGAAGSGGNTYWVKDNGAWSNPGNSPSALPLPAAAAAQFDELPGGSDFVTATITTLDGDGNERTYEGLGLSSLHSRYIGDVLSEKPSLLSESMERLYAIKIAPAATAFSLRASLALQAEYTLSGGSDGSAPSASDYRDALTRLGGVEDISIIAAPGSSAYAEAQAIRAELIAAAETRRSYRIAVLDAGPNDGVQDVPLVRSTMDSHKAALYYPWVIVSNPLSRPEAADVPREIALPPSAFVTGIYARSDIERGVFKAPANEVVRSALRLATEVNFAQQETLNPQGINCLRFFPNRGYRVWGARTASSDPEWKYVNVRRYFNYLERSIDVGTQWAVFEPNGDRLWTNIRETIGNFLYSEWRTGALLGTDPKQAFFVRCDRTTMDQNNLDNGQLICLIGVAVVKPAEFVIFRIGQKTADSRT